MKQQTRPNVTQLLEEAFSNIPSDQKDESKVNNIDARSKELSSSEPSVSTFRTIINKLINW